MHPIPVHVAGIAGSIRRASINRGLIRAAAGVLPEGSTLEIVEIDDLPLYNDDLLASPPESVTRFQERVRLADAVLFATPEYNYSIPAPLKNAIDWGSRPPQRSVWPGKAAAVMGASGGGFGTVRAQLHLRHAGVFTDLHFVNKPEVLVSRAADKFDTNGDLTDDGVRENVRALVAALVRLARVLRAGREAVG